MEGMFRSMAASERQEHTDEFKRQMLLTMLSNSSATMAAPEVSTLLSLFVEWALVSDSTMLNATGLRLFTELAVKRPEEYRAHVTPNLFLDLLSRFDTFHLAVMNSTEHLNHLVIFDPVYPVKDSVNLKFPVRFTRAETKAIWCEWLPR